MKIAVLGLGEAGSHFANDLIDLGYEVSGWDPELKRKLNSKVAIADNNPVAVKDADLIFNVNLTSVSKAVAEEVKHSVKSSAIFCEMNTSSPQDKLEVKNILDGYCGVLDVAIMAPVPPSGIQTPLLVAGASAQKFKQTLSGLNNISVTEGPVGEAAKLKLLRSIVYKGVAAVICEAMEAADHFDKQDYMRHQIASIIGENPSLVDRFIQGSRVHAIRRSHEMEAVSAMLQGEELSAIMSEAAIDNLKRYITWI